MRLLSVFTGSGDYSARCYGAKSAALKRTFKSHEGCVNKLEVALWFLLRHSAPR